MANCVCDGPYESGKPGLCWGVPGETEGCDACLTLDPEAQCLANQDDPQPALEREEEARQWRLGAAAATPRLYPPGIPGAMEAADPARPGAS